MTSRSPHNGCTPPPYPQPLPTRKINIKYKTSGSPHNGQTRTPHAKFAKLVQMNLENQGRRKGDWGVYGKVLTSGSPHDRQTLPHPTPPHPIPHTHTLKLVLMNPENQGRLEGDWGVCRKVLTSGSPHNGWITHPHSTSQTHTHKHINIKCKTCPDESGEPRQIVNTLCPRIEFVHGVHCDRTWVPTKLVENFFQLSF